MTGAVEAPDSGPGTLSEEEPHFNAATLLSEAALAEDWDRPEKDAAWQHLQATP